MTPSHLMPLDLGFVCYVKPTPEDDKLCFRAEIFCETHQNVAYSEVAHTKSLKQILV